jgi:ABC-type spermidine/putrescine transport system permease subunit I
MYESKQATSYFSSSDRVRLRVPPWIWLTAPYIVILLAFLAAPLGNVILLSFYTHSPDKIWVPVPTLENYRQLFSLYFLNITLRTLRLGAIATVFCIILGYPVAYYLARCSKRALAISMFILVMPLMVSAVVGAFGWIVILGRNGLLNTALKTLGVDGRVDVLYTETAVVIALVHFLLPLMVLPLSASIERISPRLEEVAVNLGAGPLLTFRRVILPLSLPGLLSGALLCFTIAISVVVTPALLGGRSGRMFGNEIYDQVITAYNWPLAASLAVVLVALIFLAFTIVLASGRSTRRHRGDER